MASLINTIEQQWIDHVCNNAAMAQPGPVPGQLFLAVWDIDPGEDGALGTEATGGPGPYARIQIPWGAITANALSNNAQISFTGMPAGAWNYCAIMDAAAAGNMVARQQFANAPVNTNAGETITIDVGDLDFVPSNVNLTPYTGDMFLDHVLLGNNRPSVALYMSLHDDDAGGPGDNGAREFAGANYARQLVDFNNAIVGGTGNNFHICTNNGQVDFIDMLATDSPMEWWGFFDALTVGNFVARYQRSAALGFNDNDNIQFPDTTVQLGVH